MTSIIDQYNSTLKKDESQEVLPYNLDGLGSTGYVNIQIQNEVPIFSKQKMKLNLPNDITNLVVSGNWLIVLMAHQVLLRLFLLQPDKQDGNVHTYIL